MSNNYSNAFSEAFLSVVSMFGAENVSLSYKKEYGSHLDVNGVVCIVGVIGDLQGNVIFSCDETCAKAMVSYMMGGMEVEAFDEMAQSAFSELGNMLAANACMNLSQNDIQADISTPTLLHGVFTVTASYDHVTCLSMDVSGQMFNIFISLEPRKQ